MHSSPTNIPDIKPGDNIRARTLNHIADIAKANSNTNQSGGMHGYSTSSGTSYGLSADLTKDSFFVMITNGWNAGHMNSFVGGAGKRYPSGSGPSSWLVCKNGLRAYSWVEMVEDYDITRYGSEIFPINSNKFNSRREPVVDDLQKDYTGTDPNPTDDEKLNLTPIYLDKNGTALRDPWTITEKDPVGKKIYYPPYGHSCRPVNIEGSLEESPLGSSRKGRFGIADNYPVYEANNKILPLGQITRAYQGMGNYLIVVTPPYDVYNQPKMTVENVCGDFPAAREYRIKVHPNLYNEKGSEPGCCGKYVVATHVDANDQAIKGLIGNDLIEYNTYKKCMEQFYSNSFDSSSGYKKFKGAHIEGGIPEFKYEGKNGTNTMRERFSP